MRDAAIAHALRRGRGKPARKPHLVAPGFAAPVMAALREVARGAGDRVVRLAVRRDAAVTIVVDPHVQPHLRHPLGVAHGAGPGADHFLRARPAALDDHQRIGELLLPVGAPPRLAPGERRERGHDRPHVLEVDHDVAEGAFHAPQAEHDERVDAVIALDAREQVAMFAGALLAGPDAPVRDPAVEILPNLLVELGLLALEREHRHVGFEIRHHAGVGRIRHAAGASAGAKGFHPARERQLCRLRVRRAARERRHGRCAQRGSDEMTALHRVRH